MVLSGKILFFFLKFQFFRSAGNVIQQIKKVSPNTCINLLSLKFISSAKFMQLERFKFCAQQLSSLVLKTAVHYTYRLHRIA